jgi:AcrR family transcriptional regulator
VNAHAAAIAPGPSFFFSAEERRRAEILDAALAVFSEKGYEGGTMRDIARRVGVTEPALYRHFASKEDLFLTLLEAIGGRMRGEIVMLLDRVDPADIPGSVSMMFADRRQAMPAYAPALRMILVRVAHSPVFLGAYRDAIAVPMRTKITEVVGLIDAHHGIVRPAEETAARVRTLVSLAVGAIVTSVVLRDEPESATADSVMQLMGWGP